MFGLSEKELKEVELEAFNIEASRSRLREKIDALLFRLAREKQTLINQRNRLNSGTVSTGLILLFFEEQGVVSTRMLARVFGKSPKWANTILHRL